MTAEGKTIVAAPAAEGAQPELVPGRRVARRRLLHFTPPFFPFPGGILFSIQRLMNNPGRILILRRLTRRGVASLMKGSTERRPCHEKICSSRRGPARAVRNRDAAG